MSTAKEVRREPIALTALWKDPLPPVAVGMCAWAIGLIVSLLAGCWSQVGQICLAGLVVGTVGLLLFLRQRRDARRGDRSAQRGLT